MIGDLTVLALVTARGGSQGLAHKNLREVGGRSLLIRAIESGQWAETVDRVVLSSDDPEIIRAALLAGCDVPFVRPPELATAEARSIDVVHHALETLPERYDLIVLLQPTSPLRLPEDVDEAVELCLSANAPACVSLTSPDKSPYWMYSLSERRTLQPVLPGYDRVSLRQGLPDAYAINGAVYVARSDWIMTQDSFMAPDTVGYLMPRERSIDVDDEYDLMLAEAVEAWLMSESGPEQALPSQSSATALS